MGVVDICSELSAEFTLAVFLDGLAIAVVVVVVAEVSFDFELAVVGGVCSVLTSAL